jgi:hypothetical protein
MNNIYYSPQDFGLELVGTMEWSEPNYSFDMLAVWKEKRGRFWIGQDAGCSCPSPFEDIRDVNELDGPHTKDGLRKRIDFLIEDRTNTGYLYGYSKAQLKKFASEILSRA